MFGQKTKNIIARALLYIVLIFNSLIILIPIYVMLMNSLKSNKEIFTRSPLMPPFKIVFDNYLSLFRGNDSIIIYYRNSIFITVTTIIILLILSSLCAYALGKYKFPLNRIIYIYFIIGLFIPVRLGTINIAQIMMKLNLYNNLFSLVLLYTAIGIPFAIFVLTDFIKMIPEELSNAARIDGCSEMGIFIKIILPLIKPALVTVTIFNMIWIWNDFWFPLILVNEKNLRTITFAISKYLGTYGAEYGKLYAALSAASVPMLITYLVLSKYYIKGLTGGALKG